MCIRDSIHSIIGILQLFVKSYFFFLWSTLVRGVDLYYSHTPTFQPQHHRHDPLTSVYHILHSTSQARCQNYRHSIFSSLISTCLLYTSDAADERSSVDLGG